MAKIRRRSSSPPPVTREEAHADVAAFLSEGKKPRRAGSAKLPAIEVCVDEADRRARTGDWADAKGRAFVGLYALCYRLVYGAIPLELYENGPIAIGSRMATKALHEYFGDDPAAMVEFVKWAWDREKRRHSWALNQGHDRNRLGIRAQFCASMVEDYRIAQSGRRRHGGSR